MQVHLQDDMPTGKVSQNLLSLGEGKLQVNPHSGPIKHTFCDWLCERAILSPRNSYVNNISLKNRKLLPGVQYTNYKKPTGSSKHGLGCTLLSTFINYTQQHNIRKRVYHLGNYKSLMINCSWAFCCSSNNGGFYKPSWHNWPYKGYFGWWYK